MHERIFAIVIVVFGLFASTIKGLAQEVATDSAQTETPVILYSGTPKKFEIADIKVEGADNYEDYVIIGLSGLSKGQTISIPGEEITIARLPYNAERKYDFYDILNIDEISPSYICIANKNGQIFQTATLDGSIPLFQNTGHWSEESENKIHKWIYNHETSCFTLDGAHIIH